MLRRNILIQTLAGMSAISGFKGAFSQGGQSANRVVRIAAASDLKFALADVAMLFQQDSGVSCQITYGSSGNFARQISQGLPVDLFLSADEDLVFGLADAGFTRRGDRGALYAIGRIALFLPLGSDLALDPSLNDLKLRWGQVNKFAIANPEHAPYGRAAKQALEKLGLWEMVSKKLVLGENIAQATQFVSTGAAQAGITALSLALAPEVSRLGRYVALPETLHAPLRQRMVLTRNAGTEAEAFFNYLQSPKALQVLRRYGFGL